MTGGSFARVVEMFDRVAGLEESERMRILDAECPPELRAEVERLLRADAADGVKIDALASDLHRRAAALDIASSRPVTIGGYRVLDVLGQGGMGVVYRAEQSQPRRIVAVKVIRPELMSPRLLRRFELEEKALARLQHPGIAQIYEAGVHASEHGPQPFFAMECVDGMPLTRYAQVEQLPVAHRLELLATVCDAVQHAHRNGVIHRDLKPANILVTADGTPKVLDFGVAHLTESDHDLTTVGTTVEQLVGTLPYMSPEQVGKPRAEVDTRSDVYSLGVVAFELLADKPPFDLRGKSLAECARVLEQDEPTTLGTAAPQCRGDLETIVAKALDKDPDRRYGSASELAADLRRFLRDEPIEARPPSTGYRVRKFVRRNKGLVAGLLAAVSILFGSMLVVLLITLHFLDETRQERDEKAAALTVSHARFLNAQAERFVETDAGKAILLALEAGKTVPVEARQTCASALRQLREIKTLIAHPREIAAVAFRPDGAVLASACAGGWVNFWDGTDLSLTTSERLHTAPITDLCWSRDGTRLMSASVDGDVVITEASGRKRRISTPKKQGLQGADLSPDGRMVVIVTGRACQLWDTTSGTIAGVLRPDSDRGPRRVQQLMRARFDSDGAWVVAGTRTQLTCVFDVSTRKQARSFPGRFLCVDRGHVFVLAGEQVIRAYDVASGDKLLEFQVAHEAQVVRASAVPDGTFATTSFDGTCLVHDRSTGAVLARVACEAELTSVGFAGDGTRMATGAKDGTVRVWRNKPLLSAFVESRVWQSPCRPFQRFRTGHDEVAALAPAGELELTDLLHGVSRLRLRNERARLLRAACDPGGSRVAAAAEDGTILVWNLEDPAQPAVVLPRPGVRYSSLTWGPKGRNLFACYQSGPIEILSAAGEPLGVLPCQPAGPRYLEIDPSGKRALVIFGRQATGQLWDLESRTRVGRRWFLRRKRQRFVVGQSGFFRSDGRRFVVTGRAGIRLVDSATAQQVVDLPGVDCACATFHPIERDLIAATYGSGSGPGIARVIDLRDRRVLHETRTPGTGGCTVSFAPDGRKLLLVSPSGRGAVWDPFDSNTLDALDCRDKLEAGCFSPDGRWILTRSTVGGVRVWPTDVFELARRVRPRDFFPHEVEELEIGTAASREQYRGEWRRQHGLPDVLLGRRSARRR